MIKEFQGDYRFLSNFWHAKVILDGLIYPSVEHAYVASKTLDKEIRAMIRNARSAGEAKRMGHRLTLRPDWKEVRLSIMEDLVRQKFQHELLKGMLLLTGDEELVEGNYWHDNFWGRCTCINHRGNGLNHLGKIIMKVRNELRQL